MRRRIYLGRSGTPVVGIQNQDCSSPSLMNITGEDLSFSCSSVNGLPSSLCSNRFSNRKRKPDDQEPQYSIKNINNVFGFDKKVAELMSAPSTNFSQGQEYSFTDDEVPIPNLSATRTPECKVKISEPSSNESQVTSSSASSTAYNRNCSIFSTLPANLSVNGTTRISLTDEQRQKFFDRTIFADRHSGYGIDDDVKSDAEDEDYDGDIPLFPDLDDEEYADDIKVPVVHKSMKLFLEEMEAEDLSSVATDKFEDVQFDDDFEQLETIEFILGALGSDFNNPYDNQKATASSNPNSIPSEISRKLSSASLDGEFIAPSPSPKAKSYDFNKAFLMFNPTGMIHSARSTPISPFSQSPFRRMYLPSPTQLSEQEAFEMEYKPWIPTNRPSGFLDETFEALYDNFDLEPMPSGTEVIETPETEDTFEFFPDSFKPFQDYGKFVQDEPKLLGAIGSAKNLSQEITKEVIKRRSKNLQAKYREGSKSRHEIALKYAAKATEEGRPEGDWIHLFLAGGVVDFTEIPFNTQSPLEDDEWTLRRCREFICAIIPSIEFNANFEEVLSDFMTDFFKKVLKKAIDQNMNVEAVSQELTQVARRMIKGLISPTIFSSFLSYAHSHLSAADAESLYSVLVETVERFSIPEPMVMPVREEPREPRKKDSKYKTIKGGKAAKEKVFEEDKVEYKKALKQYNNLVAHDLLKARYHDDVIRYKNIQRTRSFEFLKFLVTYLPEPILRPNSPWLSPNYLSVKRREPETSTSTTATTTTASTKANSSKGMIDKLIMGQNAHENQDFFDALFFSKILRGCLILENSIDFVAEQIDPFLKSHQIKVIDSTIGFRYLKAINKFIKITRFNVVANEIPQIINYRRYLVAYLIRDGASWMGLVPSKVQSRCITLEFLSIFESLHLYQVLGSNKDMDFRADRLKTLISTKEISFQIPIIYYLYNPIEYQVVLLIIESVLKEVPEISMSKMNACIEIFAMAKIIPLLSIYNRKVLKFKRPLPFTRSVSSPQNVLENINKDLPQRRKLPENYEAVYEWNMSRRLKNIAKTGSYLHHPYGTFASRILLARQFGISFDASNFITQLNESFTWIECVEFVNFYLEREAQILIDRASPIMSLDADMYQVYRVYDSQEHLHRIRQLPHDEPTHHINLFMERAINSLYNNSSLPKEELDRMVTSYTKTGLFSRLSKGLMHVDAELILSLTDEVAAKILLYFLNERNVPEAFDLRLFL